MPQDTAEHGQEDAATSSTRRCDSTCAQEERLEMQRRSISQAERLLEMQRRNLAQEEQLLEWQKKSLEQDERILEMQKRTESLRGKQSDAEAREKAEAKLRDADVRFKELEAILKDLQVNQNSTNVPPSYTQSITTTLMDSKAAKTAPPQCTGICEQKEELLRVCDQMQDFERYARDKLARLTVGIKQIPDQDRYLEHQKAIKELRCYLDNYNLRERKIQDLFSQHGSCLVGEIDEAFQNLRKHNDEGRKTISDIIEEARTLLGPPDLAAIARHSPRAKMVLALGCRH